MTKNEINKLKKSVKEKLKQGLNILAFTRKELKTLDSYKIRLKICKDFLKYRGLNRLKNLIYIMETCSDLFPFNKYPSWNLFIKAKQKSSRNFKAKGIFQVWYFNRDTLEDMEYQLDEHKRLGYGQSSSKHKDL